MNKQYCNEMYQIYLSRLGDLQIQIDILQEEKIKIINQIELLNKIAGDIKES